MRIQKIVLILMMLGLPVVCLAPVTAVPQVLSQVNSARIAEADRLLDEGTEQYNKSQFSAALQSWQAALKIYQDIKDRQGEGTSLGNLGLAYYSLGNYTKAIEFHQQRLAIAREIGDCPAGTLRERSGEGRVLGNLGNTYGDLGNYTKAIEYLQQSLAIARDLGDCPAGTLRDRLDEGNALGNLGNAYGDLGNYTKAIEYQQQSLVIAREIGDCPAGTLRERSGEGWALRNLGIAYQALGNYTKAIEYQQQHLAIAREIGDRQGEGNSLHNLGLALYYQGNLAAAERTLRDGINVLESLRNDTGNDANKISIFETQANTYRNLQEVLIAQNKTDAALEIAERGRARAFVELLARRFSTPSEQAAIPAPNIEQIKQIAKTQKATLVEYSIVDDELFIWVIKPTGEIAFRRSELKNINLADAAERSRVAAATGRNRGVEQQDTVIADSVRGSRSSIDVATGSVEFEPPPPPDIDITIPPPPTVETAPTVAAPITNPTVGAINGSSLQTRSNNKRLQQLHKLLISPIANLLPSNPDARVIFIPHQSLFLVPFPALQDESGKYLIEKHTIQTAPAIQVLDFTHKSRNRVTGKNALLAGNPTIENQLKEQYRLEQLDGAEQEAIDIAKLLNATPLLGNQPTKSAIKQQLSQSRIIHLATHGLLDDFNFSDIPGGIILAPDGSKDNGLLTTEEILKLKLNAELVVVSACDTGRGRITGDGVIGLSRSLISAGASSLIVSLWQIPDGPTAELMTEFYRNLPKTKDKAVALRLAMLKTMEKHPNPRDWAAFTLIGEAQ